MFWLFSGMHGGSLSISSSVETSGSADAEVAVKGLWGQLGGPML